MVGPPAIAGMLMCGGLQRALRFRTSLFWIGFAVWMVLAIPFSTWPGGSLKIVMTVLRTELPMYFVVAGVVVTWAECKTLMRVIAAAAILPILSSRLFAQDHERLMLDFGTASNANDLAAHILLVIPFLLYEAFTNTSKFLRLAALGTVGFGLFIALNTASRGALVSMVVATLFFLFRSTRRQKFAILMLVPVAAVGLLSMLSSNTLTRLLSFSESGENVSEEAIGSSQSREYLLRKSIEFTVKNPLFGVGPGQFATQEGVASREEGQRGNWHDPHNSYTQISAECGLPAALFQLAAIASAFFALNRLWGESRKRNDTEVATIVQCLLLSFVVYGVAAAFLNLGYRYYFLVLTALVVAVTGAVYRDRWRPTVRVATPAPVPPAGAARRPALRT